jgi:hypothetical protein
MDMKEFRKALNPPKDRLNIDIVIINIPKSYEIAYVFVELGVPHVIFFDSKEDNTN